MTGGDPDGADILRSQWRTMAPVWIRESREGRNPTRNGLLDPPMLEACGEVRGLRIVDLGCGEGRFCRLLAQRGAAHVLGLDACPEMIEAAAELQTSAGEYRVADIEDLSFIADGSFDLAVSYLSQCDLVDPQANNRGVFRLLRRGGGFVVANLHPMRSAVGAWCRSPEGEKLHVVLDRYLDEGERRWKILGIEITNFHRTLSTCVNGFLDAGFVIERILEPGVTPEILERYPELDDERRVPNFIIYVLRKP